MKKIVASMLWVAFAAHAQLDRAGNVIESDGGGSGSGVEVVLTGIAIGAIIGMVWAKHQQSKGKKFATDGGAVIGGLIGMFVWPVVVILIK